MDTLKCFTTIVVLQEQNAASCYLQQEFGPSQLVATRIKTANGSLFKQIIVVMLYLISRLIIAATMG